MKYLFSTVWTVEFFVCFLYIVRVLIFAVFFTRIEEIKDLYAQNADDMNGTSTLIILSFLCIFASIGLTFQYLLLKYLTIIIDTG